MDLKTEMSLEASLPLFFVRGACAIVSFIPLNTGMIFLYVVLWLIGFVLYGAYMGKGDKDFWWGK
jgi:hypothetical protein